MPRRSFVALPAFAAAWLLTGASAAPARGSLSGTVLGPDGKAVARARVFLQMSDARAPRTTLTDTSGHYSFRSLRSGLYELRAQGGGHWSDWEHNIVVRSGRETTVTLHLLLRRTPIRKASLAQGLTAKGRRSAVRPHDPAVDPQGNVWLACERASQVREDE